MRKLRTIGAAGLALALLAACNGGGGNADSTTSAAPTTTGTTRPGETTTTASTTPPTTAEPLEPCPVDALDSASGPVEITFWFAMASPNSEALQELTDQYNASQQKVKVTLQNQLGYDESFDKYRTASANDRPELIQLPEYYLQIMMDSKTAIPAQSCIEADGYETEDWVQRALEYYDIRGAVQALPFNMSSPVLYFNRKAFTDAGLDPAAPPADLDALQEAAATVTASGVKKYGIALESGTNSGGGWFVEQFAAKANQLYVNNENGRAERATEAVFDTAEGAANLGVLGQMVKDGTAVYVGENASGQDSLLRLVAPEENAAMAIASSAFLGGAVNLAKAGTFEGFSDADLGVGPFPGPAGDGGVVIGGAALWMVKGKGDEKTAATWDYMKFLTSPEAQSTWAAKTGYVPIRQSAVELEPVKSVYAADPRFKVAYDQLLTGEETPATAGGVAGPLRQIRSATATAVRSVLEGGDPAAALKTAADEADKQIADYNQRVGA